jgi:putative SOS response-associated peptidase YedK
MRRLEETVMCGRYLVITEDEIIEMKTILEELNQRFSDESRFETKNSVSFETPSEICPGMSTPVLVMRDSILSLEPMKWGFSRWDGKAAVINARAETVEEKSFFRDAFSHNRCIVPSRGFFEWKKPSSAPLLDLIEQKDPVEAGKYWIHRADSPLFLMAGIYQEGKEGGEFVVLTMPANEQIQSIHDRMPVFVEKTQLLPWFRDPRVLRLLLDGSFDTSSFLLTPVKAKAEK